MFGNNTFNIDLIAKQYEYQNDAIGANVFIIRSAQKNFRRSFYRTSLREAIN